MSQKDSKLPKLFIVSAPSGAGKTTLVREMMKRFDNFEFSVSATTRKPRSYEEDGKHYYFLNVEEFKRKIRENAFVEYEEVYPGRFYGTLGTEVERILLKGNNPIFDVDVEGGLNLKHQFGERAVAIFIQPPSLEVLAERLRNRGTEKAEDLQKRIAKATHELSYAVRFDYVLVNDDLQEAITQFEEIINANLH